MTVPYLMHLAAVKLGSTLAILLVRVVGAQNRVPLKNEDTVWF